VLDLKGGVGIYWRDKRSKGVLRRGNTMFTNFCKDLVYLRDVEKFSMMEARVCWDAQGVERNGTSGG